MEKKKKITIESDRISALPDSILHHIFSFLNILKAVQSSRLSKRWRYLWTSLPTLNFEFEDPPFRFEVPPFVIGQHRIKNFVNKVLILRDGSNIQKFSFNGQFLLSRYVNDWIICALRRNVEELVIEMCFEHKYPLPKCLFNSKSLTILNLISEGTFLELTNIPDSMCLPKLKTMFLDLIKFVDDDQTNRFFSSCPILESLTIKDSIFTHTNLKISSLSLKHLMIETSWSHTEDVGPVDGSVKLCTPNLISFHCTDYMENNYVLENLSSLFKVYINLTYYDEELSLAVKKNMFAQRMLKFLGALHNVTDLTLSGSSATILEFVSAPALLESNPVRSLTINVSLSGDCIHTLLQMSPAIEILYIKWTLTEENWEVELSSECLLNHLKRVEIREAEGSVNELKFLETLLKNAVVLETLMIVFASTEVSVTDRETRFVKFGEKLQAFPKASSSITVMLI